MVVGQPEDPGAREPLLELQAELDERLARKAEHPGPVDLKKPQDAGLRGGRKGGGRQLHPSLHVGEFNLFGRFFNGPDQICHPVRDRLAEGFAALELAVPFGGGGRGDVPLRPVGVQGHGRREFPLEVPLHRPLPVAAHHHVPFGQGGAVGRVIGDHRQRLVHRVRHQQDVELRVHRSALDATIPAEARGVGPREGQAGRPPVRPGLQDDRPELSRHLLGVLGVELAHRQLPESLDQSSRPRMGVRCGQDDRGVVRLDAVAEGNQRADQVGRHQADPVGRRLEPEGLGADGIVDAGHGGALPAAVAPERQVSARGQIDARGAGQEAGGLARRRGGAAGQQEQQGSHAHGMTITFGTGAGHPGLCLKSLLRSRRAETRADQGTRRRRALKRAVDDE